MAHPYSVCHRYVFFRCCFVLCCFVVFHRVTPLLGQVIWPGTSILSHFLLSSRGSSLIENRICMELGAGAGVPGFLAALGRTQSKKSELIAKKAKHVTLTDHQEEVMNLLRRNVEENQTRAAKEGYSIASLSTQLLDWGPPIPSPPSTLKEASLEGNSTNPPLQYEVLLGSDIVYSAVACSALMKSVSTLLHPPSDGTLPSVQPILLLSYISRWCTVDAALLEEIEAHQLEKEVIPLEEFMPPSSLRREDEKPEQKESNSTTSSATATTNENQENNNIILSGTHLSPSVRQFGNMWILRSKRWPKTS